MKIYTAQVNSLNNIIVCKGEDVRKSYQIVFTGAYNDCLKYKVNNS